jgi:hypothetical protein
MSSHYPRIDVEAHVEALYREGQRIRDEWWSSYVAGLNAYLKAIGSARQLSADFGHLVPRYAQQTMPPPEAPSAGTEYRDAGHSVPDMTPVPGTSDQDHLDRWYQAVGRSPEPLHAADQSAEYDAGNWGDPRR